MDDTDRSGDPGAGTEVAVGNPRAGRTGTLSRGVAEALQATDESNGVDEVLRALGSAPATHPTVAVVMKVSNGRPMGTKYTIRGGLVEFEEVRASTLFKGAERGVSIRVSTNI